jgi:hypothetical protein
MAAGHRTRANGTCDGVNFISHMTVAVWNHVVQMLNEWAAVMHAHELHAKANAKHRKIGSIIKRREKGELALLAQGGHQVRFVVKMLAELAHVNVVTASEQNAVKRVECFIGQVGVVWN